MKFFTIKEVKGKNSTVYIKPEFLVNKGLDLMVRGNAFYAIWDEEAGLWSRNEFDVRRIVDEQIYEYYEKCKNRNSEFTYVPMTMESYSNGVWNEYKGYVTKIPNTSHQLDEKVTFLNTEVKKSDYVSKRLPYALEKGSIEYYDKLIGVLYNPIEREKIEWSIGSIFAGDGKDIQKFIVLYGSAGTGKSTIINIICDLFEGYCSVFDAKELVSNNNPHATGGLFMDDPLVAIQHDGNLSNIQDNSKLNSIISHENMLINEKYKTQYKTRSNAFLFMGTNKPVKITDAKSGIIRRLIDVVPSGKKLSNDEYNICMEQIKFELGAIAYHCLEVYKKLGKNYYDKYRPMNMMYKTDVFFNFVQDSYNLFNNKPYITLKAAYAIYKDYCSESGIPKLLPKYEFREELKNYFEYYKEDYRTEEGHFSNCFINFTSYKFQKDYENDDIVKVLDDGYQLSFEYTESILDEVLKDCPAQYANDNERPNYSWDNVKTILGTIDTTKLHYVNITNEQHIVIDFDLKDENGNKSLKRNIEEASKWPKTYAELSKSGCGIHLHYIYDGDVNKLSNLYDENIEIKKFTGKSSLRRKLTKCNNLQIAHISTGLPVKEDDKMMNFKVLTNEKAIRTIIEKNLRKEYHASTKCSIDFIYDTLQNAYDSGMAYDVSDMYNTILSFAMASTNQSKYCVKRVIDMKFKSDNPIESNEYENISGDDRFVFFDVEIFKNVFILCWKFQGDEKKVIKWINPSPEQVESLLKYKLVGFNNRKYDNHILYAAMKGYTNMELYKLSQNIINNKKGYFGAAYNLSYTDVYDFASAPNKKSLKKWEIELGIDHIENSHHWDAPLPEGFWSEVADYCANDVIATEKVFDHLKGDWTTRQILADLTDMSPNDTTNTLSTRLVFGTNRMPQSEFNYRDLSKPVRPDDPIVSNMPDDHVFRVFDENGEPTYKEYTGSMNLPDGWSIMPFFPGYKFEGGKSSYRDVNDIGEGGYVYSETGMYDSTKTLDVASEHPTSIEEEGLFGKYYTPKFALLKRVRLLIKHKKYDELRSLFDGKLSKYIDMINNGELTSKGLSNAFKTVINSAYGLTDAGFENPFRDPRNKDNIVAKRGSLFMINLRNAVQKLGYQVIHCKTDSIKIVNADEHIIDFCCKYGKEYGYEFEIEHSFDRICLVNKAVYIGKLAEDDPEEPGKWTATGTQFAVPYVFKTLFSKEEIKFEDLCEIKSASTALYLDLNETLPSTALLEKELEKCYKEFAKQSGINGSIIDISRYFEAACSDEMALEDVNPELVSKILELKEQIQKCHNYVFIGKVGNFTPVIDGCGGGLLMRLETDGRYSATAGTTGYRWMESSMIKNGNMFDKIDKSYYNRLVDEAISTLSQFGDVEQFVA